MDKKSRIALYLIGFVMLLMVVAEITKPKAIVWRDSYSASDKIPLGCFVLFNELKDSIGEDFKISDESFYEYYKRNDISEPSTLLLINNYINLGIEESESLESFVSKGNNVFVSTLYLSGQLADTLKLELARDYENFVKNPSKNLFSSPYLKENERLFADVIENSYLKSFDTINATVLGSMTDKKDSISHVNYVRVGFGDKGGAFYVHANPFAFTNYHLLDGKEDYAASVLSFLPTSTFIWDNYYKSGRKIISSPLRFVLTNTALKWAFYVMLASMFLFVFFKGKRTQRIIPLVEPLKNSTLDFTQTIGELYYQNGDYSNIIAKKINYFFENLRSKYFIETTELNENFISKLSTKTNNSKEDTKKLVDLLVFLRSKKNHTEQDLKSLNLQIESFTKTSV
ncbi:protein of unknown function [Flavobacteriaceae bacterium MAR_2010_188]|nr:protein of unknown function [Flavobacteriaceae bacterium MAR_2010_188]